MYEYIIIFYDIRGGYGSQGRECTRIIEEIKAIAQIEKEPC